MKPGKSLDYVIPLILLLVQLDTLYLMNTMNNVISDDNRFYIGIGAVLVCMVAMRFNSRIGKWMTLAILLAGFFDLIVFSTVLKIMPKEVVCGIEYRFKLLPFYLLLLFTILNFRSLKRYLKSLLQRESELQA